MVADVLPALPPLPETHPVLGRALSRHYGRMFAGGAVLYIGAIVMVAGVVQAFDGVAALASGETGAHELGTAVGAFLVAAALLFYCFHLWRQSLGIYEHGFAVHRLFGTKVVRWDEVVSATAIRRTGSLGMRFEIEVELRGGGGVTLTDALSDIEAQALLFQSRGGIRG